MATPPRNFFVRGGSVQSILSSFFSFLGRTPDLVKKERSPFSYEGVRLCNLGVLHGTVLFSTEAKNYFLLWVSFFMTILRICRSPLRIMTFFFPNSLRWYKKLFTRTFFERNGIHYASFNFAAKLVFPSDLGVLIKENWVVYLVSFNVPPLPPIKFILWFTVRTI